MREKLRAFTLVELIVVIAILAILSTIWFISFQGYTSQSRDSVRVSDMKIVEKALVLNNVTSGNYPVPGNIDANVTHWKQWEVSKEVLARLQWISQVPVDPLTKTPMKYATTHDSKQFQLKYDLEAISQWKISQIYARNIAHKITWNYNGLFLVWNDNVYYSSIWLHSSGSTFYVNSWTVDFNIQKLQDSSNTDITPGNVESNYPDFSLALIEKYENNTDLESNWKQELLNLDKNNEYELAQFAIKILNHNPKKLKELWFTAPVEWSLPHSWECVDSVTPTDESYFVFNESTNTITDFVYTTATMSNPNPVNISDVVIPCKINDVLVEHIWENAFWSKEIDSVIFPSSIKSIARQAFYNNNITEVTIPSTITRIEERVFSSNFLTNIIIPNNIEFIWTYAFFRNYISQLTIQNDNVVLENNAFYQQRWTDEWPIIAWDNFCDTYYHEDYIDTGSLTSCSQ